MHFAGSNLSTNPKCSKCIYKISKNFRVKKAEKSLEISAFLVFSCLHLNQTLVMAGIAGFEPANAGVKVLCLDRLGYIPIKRQNKTSLMREALRILRQPSVRYFHDIIYQFSYLVKLKENRQRRFVLKKSLIPRRRTARKSGSGGV